MERDLRVEGMWGNRNRSSDALPVELALFVKIAHPAIAVTLCGVRSRPDLIFDTEHGAFGDGVLETMCEIVRLSGGNAIVRTASADALLVSRALDRGASGVMIPRVSDIDDVRSAVQGLRLVPGGSRGWDPTAAAFGYGTRRDDDRHERPRCFVQIETVAALEAVDQIASEPAVTDVFVGPADLARALGETEAIFAPAVTDAIESVARRVARGSATLGLFVDGPTRAYWARDLGYSYFAVGSDVGLLAQGADALASSLG